MKTLLKNARILKMDDSPIFKGDVVIENSRIIYLGDDSKPFEPFDVVRDIKGNILMPGFKNAHTHSGMTFLRSKTDDHNLANWLFDVVFPREAFLRPSDIAPLVKPAFLEYLTSGITACFDQYFFPAECAKASEEIGMRTVLLGTFSKDHYPQKDVINTWHRYNDPEDSLVRYCIGMHAEYTASDDELNTIKEIIQELKAPFFTHICETKHEVEDCWNRRGMSPVQFFNSLGMFDYGGGAYHCVYLDDKDIEIFKEKNLSIVTCPGSNTKLASGICPVPKYMDVGLNIAIGTDGPASNNCLDMFKEMALVNSLSKILINDPKAVGAYNTLKMATVNGAKAMGLYDCDILEVGKKADIIEIDLSRPSMQPLNDVVSNIVYSGGKDVIKMTMINGKILYADGEFHVGQTIDEIYKDCQIVTERIEEEVKGAN